MRESDSPDSERKSEQFTKNTENTIKTAILDVEADKGTEIWSKPADIRSEPTETVPQKAEVRVVRKPAETEKRTVPTEASEASGRAKPRLPSEPEKDEKPRRLFGWRAKQKAEEPAPMQETPRVRWEDFTPKQENLTSKQEDFTPKREEPVPRQPEPEEPVSEPEAAEWEPEPVPEPEAVKPKPEPVRKPEPVAAEVRKPERTETTAEKRPKPVKVKIPAVAPPKHDGASEDTETSSSPKTKPRMPEEEQAKYGKLFASKRKPEKLNEAGHALGVLETPEPDFDPEPPKKRKPEPAKEPKAPKEPEAPKEPKASKEPERVKEPETSDGTVKPRMPQEPEKPKKPKKAKNSEKETLSQDTTGIDSKTGAMETPEPDFEAEPETGAASEAGASVREAQAKPLWWENLTERWRRFLHKIPKVLWAFTVFYLIQPEIGQKTEYSDDLRGLAELPPAKAMRKLRKMAAYYRWRTAAVAGLALLAGYITAAPTLRLPCPAFISYVHYPFAYLFLLTALQLAAMFLSVSYLADGLRALPQGKWKAETLVAVASFVNLLYTFQIMIVPQKGGYLPYQMTVILMLFFGMMTRTQRLGNALRVCHAAALVRESYMAVNGIRDADGAVETVYKQKEDGGRETTLSRMWEEDPAERLMRRYVPLVLLLTLIFAVTAAAAKGREGAGFLWCWSALLSAALPGGILAAFSFPLAELSRRFARSGTLLGGYRSAKALRDADRVVLRETDFFPQDGSSERGRAARVGNGDIRINDLKTYSDYAPEKVNLYTLTVLEKSGCVLYDVMRSFLSDAMVIFPPIENFEYYENGGLGAFIEGDRVLVGTYQYISRSGIAIPEEVRRGTGLYVAVNMQFAGWYPMHYATRTSVIRSLGRLKSLRLHPIAAIRDFNLNEKLLESRFKMPEGAMEYPELAERLSLSERRDSRKDEPLAILAADGTERYVDALRGGRYLYRATRFNLLFGLLTAVAGVVLTFLLLFVRAASAVTPANLFGYGVCCFLPTLIASLGTKRR